MKKKVLLPKLPTEEETIPSSFSHENYSIKADKSPEEFNEYDEQEAFQEDFQSISENKIQENSENKLKDEGYSEEKYFRNIDNENSIIHSTKQHLEKQSKIKYQNRNKLLFPIMIGGIVLSIIVGIVALFLLMSGNTSQIEQPKKIEKTSSLDLPFTKNEITFNKIILEGNNIKTEVSIDKVSSFAVTIKTDKITCATPILHPDEVKGQIVIPCKEAPNLMKITSLEVEDY